MAAQDNITDIGPTEGQTDADRRWASAEQFVAKCREENEAQRKAIEVLYDCTPLEFAQRNTRRLKHLLALLPPDQYPMDGSVAGDMIWWARDIAEQIETAVDLVSEPAQKGGVQ
jgi:hypothetical protein